MKNKIYVVVIAIITIILLVISFLFAINYKKESENYFYESGYILSNNYESGSENVSKLYFDAETSYKNNKKDEYTFKNSEGEKVKVSEDSFVHYSNGSIMSLKKGVAIDLNEIDAKLINYYNVFEGSVLTKKNEVYEIDNLDKKINFGKLMFKISNEKYLIGAPKIIISFSDEQTVEMEDYVEIEYVSENVIRVYNDKMNYQTIASNLYVIIDNVRIDLEYKTISKDGNKYLTMADMIINSDDNIEILPQPEEPEKIEETEDGQNNTLNNNGQTSNNQGTQNNNANGDNGYVDPEIQQGIDNLIGNLPENNEQVDTENEFIQPKFKVDSMDMTTLGFENLSITFEDESSILYGNRIVEIIENSTGKVVQRFEDWQEGTPNYKVNSYYSLKPNTEYTLNVIGQYKVDETVFDRTFVSKIFRTLDIGLEITEDYISSDSLSFAIYRSSYSGVNGFSYSITDKKGNVLVEDVEIDFDDSNVKIITEAEKFNPNTEYTLTLKDIKYGNKTFLTVSYEKLKIDYKTKTLKENPFRNSEVSLTHNINNRENTITFNVDGINDLYGGIKSYTYNIYNSVGELKHTILKEKADSLTVDLDKLNGEDTIFFNVEVNYDDNEKTIMFVSQNSEPISISGVKYPKIVEFLKGKGDTDAQQIVGNIIIDDEENFIPTNGVSKYKIDIKENNNSALGETQQHVGSIKMEQEKTDTRFPLSVFFAGLTPETEYVLYVYLLHNGEYIYLGYEVVNTEPAQPIYLNVTQGEGEDSKNYLFNFEITKSANSSSSQYIRELNLELYGCSKANNECKKLDFSRTVPRDQNNLNELYDAMQYDPEKEISESNPVNAIYVNSNEFNFDVSNYEEVYNYKVVASGKSSNYEIPVKINGNDSNEFEIEFNDVEPKIELKEFEVPKSDCESSDECKTNYGQINEGLSDKTVVGFDFNISTFPNPMGQTIKQMSYKIYENNDSIGCENLSMDNLTPIIESTIDITSKLFIPIGNSDNDIALKRGKSYCLEYYGIYNFVDKEENKIDKNTTPKLISLETKKQGVKIKGYIKNYDGKDLILKLNITDPDDALIQDSLKLVYNQEEIKVESGKSENEYIASIDNTLSRDYSLMIKENVGAGEIDRKIQEINLDEINFNENVKIIVDASSPGEVMIKVPIVSGIDVNRIAGMAISTGNKTNYLSFDGYNDDELYKKITLESIKNLGIGAIEQKEVVENGITQTKDFWYFDSIELIYDSGRITDYKDVDKNQPILIVNKNINSDVNEKYYYKSNSISGFSTIKIGSMFYPLTLDENVNLVENEFDSTIEGSRIGISLIKPKSSTLVYFNEIAFADSVLYDINDQPYDGESIEVKSTLSTSSIETKYNSTGAKIRFRMANESISSGTKLQVTLNNGEFKEEAIITYDSKWNTYSGSEKIKSINIGEATEGEETFKYIEVEFSDITESGYTYSINYSIDDLPFEPTYNIANQRTNSNIRINSLKELKLVTFSSEYIVKNWTWNEDYSSMTEPIRKITNNFEVDTSVYELNQDENIIYSVFAMGCKDKVCHDLTDINDLGTLIDVKPIEENIKLDSMNSKDYLIDEFYNSAYDEYNIRIQPYIVNKDNEKIPLKYFSLGIHTIQKRTPDFYVENTDKANFKIRLGDLDAVLRVCNDEYGDISKLYSAAPIIFSSTVAEKYFNENKFNSNSVYFEIYDADNTFIGYSPLPFADSAQQLYLTDYFSENGFFNGVYTIKINYCMEGKKGIQTKIFENIELKDLTKFKMQLIDTSDSYVLMFENPDLNELNKINRIKYQFTDINGFSEVRELSNLDNEYNTTNNINFINSTVEGTAQVLYFVGIPIGIPTSRIRNIEIKLYEGEEDMSPLGVYPN